MGLFGVSETTIETVASILLILVPAMAYIFIEGRIDAAAVAKIDFNALLKELQTLFNIKEDGNSTKHNEAEVKSLEAVQATESAG